MYPGNRTEATVDATGIVASIGATCKSGLELQDVTVPALSPEFNITYGSAVEIASDADAQFYAPPWTDLELSAPQPFGFRAIWLG